MKRLEKPHYLQNKVSQNHEHKGAQSYLRLLYSEWGKKRVKLRVIDEIKHMNV